MAKNIVICCDGTGNEFGDRNSNVVKLYKTLVCDPNQSVYYHPGVGTMGARNALTRIGKWWTRMVGLAFGYGTSENVADAYQFLMRIFEPGDRIYVFGFSRGAYTARVLCGMIHIVGLLTRGNEGLIPYAIRMIKKEKIDFAVADDFKKTFSHNQCKPHFVGVWDTVSTVGWIYNAVHFPFTRAANNPDLNVVRHAISIDERRTFFRQNLFGKPNNPGQDVKEVWFPGVHSDVGGSYPESESQLSKIAFQWMLGEAKLAGLRIDPEREAEILGGKAPYVAADPSSENQHESLSGFWRIAEVWPKVSSTRSPGGTWKKGLRFNLARRRRIPPDAILHDSVKQRIMARANSRPPYNPSNLPGEPRYLGEHAEHKEFSASQAKTG